MASNFAFLRERFPALFNLGNLAERYCGSDSNSCLMKLGMIGETIVNLMFAYDNIPAPFDNTAVARINTLFREGLLTEDLCGTLHRLRKYRNKAAHEGYESVSVSASLLEAAYSLCEWFMQTYGDWNYQNHPFVPVGKIGESEERDKLDTDEPDTQERPTAVHAQTDQAAEANTDRLIQAAEETAAAAPAFSLDKRRALAMKSASQRTYKEAEARIIIDRQLRGVGWEADTENLRYSKGTRPAKGRNLAIAEWPLTGQDGHTDTVDYALFRGTELLGLVEAKDSATDVSAVVDGQCREYAMEIRQADEKYTVGNWTDETGRTYRVPFLFSANGRPCLEQCRTKSGIWFRDLRQPDNIPRPLHGWPSPTGLWELLKRDTEAGNRALWSMSADILRDPDGLSLHKYQERAVLKVRDAVLEGRETMLLAMATGTGKTRVALALLYVLLASQRFRRVLFLVDRNALGEQAEEKFNEVRIKDLKALLQIYNVRGIKDGLPPSARKTAPGGQDAPDTGPVQEFLNLDDNTLAVQIATVQSMVLRLFNNDGTAPLPGITDFDLIIVDEAHRGYILDREMGKDELLYRDQADYQSQYRRVLDYFDAVKIGLTATPALHTTQIFGVPIFWYTYAEAVDEDYLVDHDAPHHLKTRLTEGGIHYKAGDTVTVLDPAATEAGAGEPVHSELLADDLDFDVDDFNRRVINEKTDRAILEEIAPDLHPDAPEVYGKTLIFAVNDAHADRIVDILRNIYKEKYPDMKLPSRAILKITAAAGGGDRERTLDLVREFKNENYVSIAVTVDLLSTGVDVPEITRLVFMRRVKSRILFEQMMGRATRKCDKLHKDHFDVYDPVGTYESLQPWSSMRPVSANPKAEFPELCNGLALAEGEDKVRAQIRQVLARLQRRAKRADADMLEQFAARMDGQTPEQFAAAIRELPAEEARTVLLTRQKALELLDKPFRHTLPVVLSNEPDEVIFHQQTYGDYDSPEDYLAAFENYLRENRDEIASLRILCTRPAELTRASLIQLRQALRDCDFTKTQLNSALSRMTNQEIAADIVSLIRRYALGSVLKSHEERIHGAVEKLKAAHEFSKVELDWIQRLEDYLMNEDVLTVSMFDEDPRYRAQGGFARFNKVFRGQLAQIVEELNVYLFDDGGEIA